MIDQKDRAALIKLVAGLLIVWIGTLSLTCLLGVCVHLFRILAGI